MFIERVAEKPFWQTHADEDFSKRINLRLDPAREEPYPTTNGHHAEAVAPQSSIYVENTPEKRDETLFSGVLFKKTPDGAFRFQMFQVKPGDDGRRRLSRVPIHAFGDNGSTVYSADIDPKKQYIVRVTTRKPAEAITNVRSRKGRVPFQTADVAKLGVESRTTYSGWWEGKPIEEADDIPRRAPMKQLARTHDLSATEVPIIVTPGIKSMTLDLTRHSVERVLPEAENTSSPYPIRNVQETHLSRKKIGEPVVIHLSVKN